MNNNRLKILFPVIIAIAICLGILIGSFYTSRFQKHKSQKSSFSKISTLLNLIEENYVDTIDEKKLEEEAIPGILAQLDPHSVYIPASEIQGVNDDLEGSFSGIGVQFNIQKDTVMIVAVVNGGPSERLGILPGDRIVTVNDSSFVGKKITNEKVLKKFRGKINTKVKVGVKRNGTKEILNFTITRKDIPVNSIDAAYPIDNGIGYIKVSKFGANTYKEFLASINRLKKQQCSKMIIDLRGNPGGYMEAATSMINEFLPKNSLIVYTKGRAFQRENELANGKGSCLNTKVVVLIDEWSASASEIFAGAIQDNDRGTIIGRRSFGKGLVQNQIAFSDSSAVRLTIARYFTPSGRCIQKPYKKGNDEEYENDIMKRFLHGEFDKKDSIKITDTLKYKTKAGRTVYGGGGIMPDIFVGRDTTGYTAYYNKLINYSYIYQYAFDYTDKNRKTLQQYKTWQQLTAYLNKQNIIDGLATYADAKGLRKNPYSIKKSMALIQNLLDAYICRNVLGDDGFYPVLNQTDVTIKKAAEVLKSQK